MKKDLNYYRKKLSDSGMEVKPNFEGISTLLGAQYRKDLQNIDIALVGIPFDIATSGYPGARLAPQAVRNIGNSPGIYSRENSIFPYENCTVADIGDITLTHRYSIEKTHQDIEEFYLKLISQNVVPLTVGGDHSVTLPILRAVAKDQPIALIHFDAHCDTEEGYGGSKYPHGSTFLNAARENLIIPSASVQIGIRDGWDVFWDKGLKQKMEIVTMDVIHDAGLKEVVDIIRTKVGNNKVYISFDIDALDPAFAPGTGTPEVGGITSYQARRFVRELKGLNIVGADVVEICPPLDTSSITTLAGSSILFELLCIVADQKGSNVT